MLASIRTKILAATIAVALIAAGPALFFAANRTSSLARADAVAYATELARNEAGQIQEYFRGPAESSASTALQIQALHEDGLVSRQVVESMLRGQLESNPRLNGTWAVFAPDSLEGADADHAYETSGSDANGVFMPWWTRSGGEITAEPAGEDASASYELEYYTVPMEAGVLKVIEPYAEMVPSTGKEELFASLAAPFVWDGAPQGVAGTDFFLVDLQKKIAEVKPYGSGYAAVFSAGGLVVAHPDAGLLAKPAAEADATKDLTLGVTEPHVVTASDSVLGEEGLQVAVPIRLTDSDTWTFVVSIPMSAVLADAASVRDTLLLAGALALLVAIGLGIWIATSIARPIGV